MFKVIHHNIGLAETREESCIIEGKKVKLLTDTVEKEANIELKQLQNNRIGR